MYLGQNGPNLICHLAFHQILNKIRAVRCVRDAPFKILTRFKGLRRERKKETIKSSAGWNFQIQSNPLESPAMHESTGSTIAKSQIEKCKKGDYFTRFRIFHELGTKSEIQPNTIQMETISAKTFVCFRCSFCFCLFFFRSLSFTSECVEPFKLSGIISLCYAFTIACFHRH